MTGLNPAEMSEAALAAAFRLRVKLMLERSRGLVQAHAAKLRVSSARLLVPA